MLLIFIQNYHHLINEYTKLDPTLPVIDNIKCPNATCDSNNTENQKKNKIIYLRVDDEKMKYLYICANCDKVWNTFNSNYPGLLDYGLENLVYEINFK